MPSHASPRLLKAAPRQTRSRDTLRRLVRATEQLLGQRCFEDISIHEILRVSGVSIGSFYARFRRKEDLLPFIYAEYSSDLRKRLAAKMGSPQWQACSFRRLIDELVASAVRTYRERSGLLRTVALLARSRPRALRRSTFEQREEQYGTIAALLLRHAGEIRHAEPARAVQVGLLFVLAACRDKVLFGDAPHPASVNVSDDELAAELSRALHAYLTTPQP